MSSKKSRPTGFAKQVCSKCKAEAHTKPGSQHRNCGSSGSTKLPKAQRGTWG